MPSRSVRTAAALALATSATAFAYAGSPAPADAAGYNGVCKTSSGVTVVVDFRNLGGGIAVRCSPVGSGATGLQALQAAGIPVEGTRQYGLAFMCRIYGQPSASTTLPGGYHESCGRTPPPNAHWWYTQAANGGSWTASGEGASSSHVIPGGFEGWAFSEGGTNHPPRYTPSRPAAPKPPPRTTSPARTTTAPPRHTTTTAPQRPRTTAPKHSGASQPHSTSSATSGSPTAAGTTKARASRSSGSSIPTHKQSSSSASVGGGASGTSSGDPTNAAGAPIVNSDKKIKDAEKSSTINATTVVGGGVLAALAIGGAAVAFIRRRSLG